MKLEEEVKCEKTDIEAVNHVFLFEQHFSCLIIFPFSEDYLLAAFYNSIPIFAFFLGENTIFHVTFCSKNKPYNRIIRLLFNFFCYLNNIDCSLPALWLSLPVVYLQIVSCLLVDCLMFVFTWCLPAVCCSSALFQLLPAACWLFASCLRGICLLFSCRLLPV